MKICNVCEEEKTMDSFYFIIKQNSYRGKCNSCYSKHKAAYHKRTRLKHNEYTRAHYAANKEHKQEQALQHRLDNPELYMFIGAKSRAKANNILFNIEVEDVILPDYCPILNIPLIKGAKRATDNSPTLDRLIPSLGYIKGNVNVISNKANRTKNDATLTELKSLVTWLETKLNN